MNLEQFIKKLEENLEDIEIGILKPETKFRELEQWDSMSALIIISLSDKYFCKRINLEEFKEAHTVLELYNLLNNVN
jgi:acyl carrier protein